MSLLIALGDHYDTCSTGFRSLLTILIHVSLAQHYLYPFQLHGMGFSSDLHVIPSLPTSPNSPHSLPFHSFPQSWLFFSFSCCRQPLLFWYRGHQWVVGRAIGIPTAYKDFHIHMPAMAAVSFSGPQINGRQAFRASPIFDAYTALHLLGNNILLPFLVVTFLVAKRVHRHGVLINLCFHWILSGIFNLLPYGLFIRFRGPN